MNRFLVSVCFACGVGCSMPYFAVDVDAPVICAVSVPVDFPGALNQRVEAVISDDLVEIGLFHELGADVSFLEFSLRVAQSEVKTLDTLRVSVFAHTMPMLDVINGQRLETEGGELRVIVDEPVNISDYLVADGMQLDVLLEGDLPTQAWAGEVDVCFSADVAYSRTL